MSLDDTERAGITDLLYREEANHSILVPLARNVVNHAIEIRTLKEALESVLTQSSNIMDLLSKRLITKEILFKYLYKKKIPFPFNATKIMLINKVIAYWHEESNKLENEATASIKHDRVYDNSRLLAVDTNDTRENVKEKSNLNGNGSNQGEWGSSRQRFPIHLLAQQFSEWFFNNYNQDSLQQSDFWPDAYLLLNVIANDGCNENECSNAENIIQTLQETRKHFNFYFLPNLTEAGVQGRMDVHGLAMALACGTLHTINDCVGVFECAFGLLRDPFAHNNWKCKTIQMQLRSKNVVKATPSLAESDSLKEALKLPTPEVEEEHFQFQYFNAKCQIINFYYAQDSWPIPN